VDELGNRYNIPLLNAVILYVATAGIRYFQGWGEPLNFENVVDSPYMGVFATLAEDFDSEGRYLFFTALANHLRYPSTHTRFFGLVILFIFLETKEFGVKVANQTRIEMYYIYRDIEMRNSDSEMRNDQLTKLLLLDLLSPHLGNPDTNSA